MQENVERHSLHQIAITINQSCQLGVVGLALYSFLQIAQIFLDSLYL